MSKNDTINIMDGSRLVDKRGVLEIFFVIYIKMSGSAYLTYYQRNET